MYVIKEQVRIGCLAGMRWMLGIEPQYVSRLGVGTSQSRHYSA